MAHSLSIAPAGCPCDRLVFPPNPVIPAGLPSLPRQLAGFPEFRLALLTGLGSHRLLDADLVPVHQQQPLQPWLAREGDDLGLMLIEMWAYVLDVLAFYEERIANESYLQTAQRERSLQRLVELIGYQRRPATAASVLLALLADTGKGLVAIPPGTAFRSSAFSNEPPQVFEVGTGSTIDPALNRWTLAPIRDVEPGDTFYTTAGGINVEAGGLVLLSWLRTVEAAEPLAIVAGVGTNIALLDVDQSSRRTIGSDGTTYTLASNPAVLFGAAARVKSLAPTKALDGGTYTQLELDPAVAVDTGISLEQIALRKPVLEARIHEASSDAIASTLLLDAVHPDLLENEVIVLSLDHQSLPFRVVTASHVEQVAIGVPPISDDAVQPFLLASRIEVSPRLPAEWESKHARLKLHYRFISAGTLIRPAKDRIDLDDLQPKAAFADTVEPAAKETSGTVLLSGADGHGAILAAGVHITAAGAGSLQAQSGAVAFGTSLRTPVKVYGNLIEATRGETVSHEVLGSGNPSRAFQSFALKKAPLTWFDDPSGTHGLRSTLSVRVNGILWTEVASFYGAGPRDEVYHVRENEDGKAVVTFGDGKTGARLPSGVGNVTASYRHGAGAAKPPAHSITQMARAVIGLRQVVNPVAAGGGSDADSADDLQTNASTSSLLLGRAVSLADFEALAREFGGVINAQATWTWDGRMQRAVIKLWFIADGGSIADDLRRHLLGQSDPNVPIETTEAQAIARTLVVDLATDERYHSDDVEQAVLQALTDPMTGLLALENIPIGAPLFRSRVLEQIHAVEGVVSVRALRFDGAEAGPAIVVEDGQYLDLVGHLIVGNTASGDLLL